MLSIVYADCHKYAVYAEHHYAECRYAECHGALEGLALPLSLVRCLEPNPTCVCKQILDWT
jgi:hypothetical protein